MRNLFLSFLGNNRYIPCNYALGGIKIDDVRFVQQALVRMLCTDFREPDRIVIFLTEDARKNNWDDTEQDNQTVPGLKHCLEAMGKGEIVRPINIPEGKSPEELWQIFKLVFDVINDNDRVIFDITHGFRSLPMLGMVLLNYARLLKNITIAGVYYGAFEVLGPLGKVKVMPMEKRNAPIFDLSDFATLLAWSSGVQEFVRHGSPAGIAELLQQEAVPRMKESRGQDATAKVWSGIAHNLREVGGQIAACRGGEIAAGTAFVRLRDYLEQCESLPQLPPPFRPLIERIATKIEPFRKNEGENCLRAAEWCLEHDLVQQGITMLQEGIVTLIAERHGLDWKVKTDRKLITESINVRKKPESQWQGEAGMRPVLVRQLHADPFVQAIAGDFDRLSQARNDINHGGFVKAGSADGLSDKMRNAYEAIRVAWSQYKETGWDTAGTEARQRKEDEHA